MNDCRGGWEILIIIIKTIQKEKYFILWTDFFIGIKTEIFYKERPKKNRTININCAREREREEYRRL